MPRCEVPSRWSCSINFRCVRSPRAVGLRRAKQMSLTGNYVPAALAREWGLVTAVVPHDGLLSAATALARDVCSNDRQAVGALLTLYDDNAADQIQVLQHSLLDRVDHRRIMAVAVEGKNVL